MPIGCQLCSGFECLKGVYSREVLQKVPRSSSENPDFQQMVGGGGGEGLTPGFHPL